jgi:hypothetical protein
VERAAGVSASSEGTGATIGDIVAAGAATASPALVDDGITPEKNDRQSDETKNFQSGNAVVGDPRRRCKPS